MRRVKKKSVLDKIDDAINDKIDEVKDKRNEKIIADKRKKKSTDSKNEKIAKNQKNIKTKPITKNEKSKIKNNNIKIKEDIKKNKINTKNKSKIKTKNVKETPKQKKKKRSWWKKVLTVILIFGIVGVLSVTAFLAYVVMTAPEFNESALTIKDQTVIYDINGEIITTLGLEKRESVAYDEVPQVLIDAIIATEDARFFQHNGVDLFRFIKATIQQLLGHGDAGGASTLTMQTVKNNVTKKDSTENTNTIDGKIKRVIRKFQDVYLAVFKIEKEYTKEEILEIYMNDNGLGSSYYGVEEASKYYFGKKAKDLTLPEAAMIAGLFQAPNRHNPYNNIESATKRRNIVLDLMLRHGYITEEERDLAKSITVESMLAGNGSNKTPYQGYIDTVVLEVEKLTDHGDGTGGDDPYTVPMKIYTTMERGIQDGINAVLANNAAGYWKDAGATAGIAVVNVETGAVAAIGSGRNKDGEKLLNDATQMHRQPGSTAKPIFDYGPGIEFNNFSSYQMFNDEPWTYTNGPSVNNWDGGFFGFITMRYALQVSRNIPALKAFQQVGARNSQKFAYSLGLNVSLNQESENYEVLKNGIDNTINEAYAIGGAAEGFTPLQMASAYSGFASGGYYTEPHTVTKIVYRESGEEKEFKYNRERVMKDSTAYIINNILESAVTSGFNGGARVPGSHVAAKTGTSNFDEATMRARNLPSNAVNDLWTVAYTSKYSVGVWYGYEKLTDGYNISSGNFKEALTAAVMQYIPIDRVGWACPSSVVSVTVEKDTWPAMLPSEFTPGDMRITELFVRGTQPTEVSPRYQRINDVTNVKSTKNNNDNSVTITWDYTTPTVLTDAYLSSYFNNSVYGNQKGHYLAARKAYNDSALGPIGFHIYRQNSDGSLTSLDYVAGNSYTYKGYGKATLIIKAEHSNFKANASAGYKVETSLEELDSSKLTFSLVGKTSTSANAGTYEEDGINNIKYNNKDVTTEVTIKYTVSGNDTSKDFNTTSDLEKYVNTLTPGTYTITYTVNYLGVSTSKKRTVIIR